MLPSEVWQPSARSRGPRPRSPQRLRRDLKAAPKEGAAACPEVSDDGRGAALGGQRDAPSLKALSSPELEMDG
eukprot:3523540-Alexandrium_andersonii.AAC.1